MDEEQGAYADANDKEAAAATNMQQAFAQMQQQIVAFHQRQRALLRRPIRGAARLRGGERRAGHARRGAVAGQSMREEWTMCVKGHVARARRDDD